MSEPLVTVLMPAYNAGLHLRDSMDSVLNQSYRNIEFLVINDGSKDNSAQIIASYTDKRLRVLDNGGNKGFAYSLNRGLKEAKGGYIARMDADDISLESRINEQVKFMELNPKVGICGTWVKLLGGKDENTVWKYPVSDQECKVKLMFNTCFAHPAVMLRREFIEKNAVEYNAAFYPAEDCELWAANAFKTEYANIPKVLLKYRIHSTQMSQVDNPIQNENKFKAQLIVVKQLMPDISKDEISLFEKYFFRKYEYTMQFLKKFEQFLYRINQQNEDIKLFDKEALSFELQQAWFNICNSFSSNKVRTLSTYKESSLVRATKVDLAYIKFYAKNFLLSR